MLARRRVLDAQRFYIAAFNHLTPFPGTPLYTRLAAERRLLFERWWLDERYRYNMVPFRPASMTPDAAPAALPRRPPRVYGWRSIVRRGARLGEPTADAFMFRNFFPINAMCATTRNRRDGYPLGDEIMAGPLLRAH